MARLAVAWHSSLRSVPVLAMPHVTAYSLAFTGSVVGFRCGKDAACGVPICRTFRGEDVLMLSHGTERKGCEQSEEGTE